VALVFSYGLEAAGLVDSPWFAAILLSATSLALIVPVLKESGQLEAPLGKLSFGEASVAEFATVLMLSALFSKASTSTGARVALAVTFVVLVLVFAWTFKRFSRSVRLARAFAKMEDGTSQIRVRATMLIVIAFVVIAEETGLEAILGALIAGALLSMLDGGYLRTHEAFRSKLDAIGFGLLIPVFFVTSGMQLDLDALWANPSRLALIPIVLVALLAVRSVVIVIYRRALSPRESVVAWILQSTLSLPFVVTATTIGRQLDLVGPATTAALVAAAVVSGLVFPALALALIPRQGDAPDADLAVDVVDP
jgi:Kef-type K+ transport system membrane component KefB